MRTPFRTPDTLQITVHRHELRSETSLEITHTEGALTVVIFDDWWPLPMRAIGHELELIVSVWERTGPIAAAALAASWKAGRRRG